MFRRRSLFLLLQSPTFTFQFVNFLPPSLLIPSYPHLTPLPSTLTPFLFHFHLPPLTLTYYSTIIPPSSSSLSFLHPTPFVSPTPTLSSPSTSSHSHLHSFISHLLCHLSSFCSSLSHLRSPLTFHSFISHFRSHLLLPFIISSLSPLLSPSYSFISLPFLLFSQFPSLISYSHLLLSPLAFFSHLPSLLLTFSISSCLLPLLPASLPASSLPNSSGF